MNELALFAGAGGGLLASRLLGWRTVCAVEIDRYCRNVLLQRQRDGMLELFPIWDDIQTFDGRPWRGCVDIVTGGFPCQDISIAGKGLGIDGPKSGLWRHMARVVREVRPRYVFVENSPKITGRGLGRVLGDLAELGLNAEWGVFSAAASRAPHLRERMFIVAYASWNARCEVSQVCAFTTGIQAQRFPPSHGGIVSGAYWKTNQPQFSGVDDGLAYRVGRAGAAGNGQVPAVVVRAWCELTASISKEVTA